MDRSPLLLASKSPRRAALLRQIGVAFELVDVSVTECRGAREAPEEYVARLAREKSAAGAQVHPGRVSLGADTIVVCDQQVLEKPQHREDCLDMLALLSNRCHQVITALALTQGERQEHCLSVSQVHFRAISPREAAAYWHSGEPRDKAGGYGIQGLAAVFVRHIEGSYSGIVGLPLHETQGLLAQFSIPCWQDVR